MSSSQAEYFSSHRALRAILFGCFPELFLCCLPCCFTYFRSDEFKIIPAFGQAITVVPGPDGLYSTGEMGQGTLKWSAFIRFQETRNLFMLYMSQSAFQVIPKRAFAGPELEKFRDLLKRRLPRRRNLEA
jgi:hypothetical protein